MKPHPDMTIDAILKNMRQASPPRAVGRPTSDAESALAETKLQEALAGGAVRFVCIGCGTPMAPQDAAVCECGGFVCAACRRTEEDGVCLHERPEGIPDDDE